MTHTTTELATKPAAFVAGFDAFYKDTFIDIATFTSAADQRTFIEGWLAAHHANEAEAAQGGK